MSELDNLKAMLDRAEIGYSVKPMTTIEGVELVLAIRTGRHVLGLDGYTTDFVFTTTGELRRMGVWEE